MPIINFQKQFIEAIKSGEKNQTIRKSRKYPIKVGDTLYLYAGLRTKNAEKLKEVKCEAVAPITINGTGSVQIGWLMIYHMKDLNEFAQSDGFDNWQDMVIWFNNIHGLPFEGQLIKWNNGQRDSTAI